MWGNSSCLPRHESSWEATSLQKVMGKQLRSKEVIKPRARRKGVKVECVSMTQNSIFMSHKVSLD